MNVKREPAQYRGAAAIPVGGIGASAGGLAACGAFFSGVPASDLTGLAFVRVRRLVRGAVAVRDHVIAAPILVTWLPAPSRRLVGDLSSGECLRTGLDLDLADVATRDESGG